jgi:glycosyltransferase involved in cell wall biosynthesis
VRILIVTQYFWPERFLVNDLALALVERGHEVTVLTGMPNYPAGRLFPGYGFFRPTREDYHGVVVRRVPLLPRGSSGRWRLPANYLSFALSGAVLGPWRGRGVFDLIFVYQPSPLTVALPALLLRRLKGIPLVLWVQDLWPESLSAAGAVSSRLVLGSVERMVRFIYRRCDRVLVTSRGFIPRVVSRSAAPDKVAYLPQWAQSFYAPTGLEAEAPERKELPDGFRVLFAGNIGEAQSFETLLDAAGRLKGCDVSWVVVGDGRRRGWLEKQIHTLGLESCVRVLGPRPAEAMPRYFALADALLISLKHDPTFALTVPMKLQSYLACARPIVAALGGEGARIVEEAGAGVTCPPEDGRALADAVLSLRDMDPERRALMGLQGRAYYEAHFDRQTVIGDLEQLMRSVHEERACASLS